MIINEDNVTIEPTDLCINCTLECHCPTISLLKDIVARRYKGKYCKITINSCEELIKKED